MWGFSLVALSGEETMRLLFLMLANVRSLALADDFIPDSFANRVENGHVEAHFEQRPA